MTSWKNAGAGFALILGLQSAAYAESFNVTGMQIVTHRGSDITLKAGQNNLDRNNILTCVSNKGCSVIAQTQLNLDNNNDPLINICTYIDSIAAAPPCLSVQINDALNPPITTFQGAPALRFKKEPWPFGESLLSMNSGMGR